VEPIWEKLIEKKEKETFCDNERRVVDLV